MTKFIREQFDYFGGYLHYNGMFIARFKYASRSSKPRWITFMCKNFTVEEWQAGRDEGVAPLTMMESKGFVLTHILKWQKLGLVMHTPTKARGEVVSMIDYLREPV